MRKIILLVVAIGVVVAIVGCKGSKTKETNKDEKTTMKIEKSNSQFISVEEAKAMIDSDEDVIFFGVLSDVKSKIPLQAEHSPIDKTFRVWRPDYSGKGSPEAISPNVGGFRKGLDSMNELLSKAGVTKDSKIIVYSTGSMHDSTRFGWQLELMGLSPMYLDGGLDAWKEAGYPTGKQVTLANENIKTKFESIEWKTEELGVDIDDVIVALENPNEWVVIDTRSQGEYNGEKTGSSKGAFGTGAIKGAVHIEWTKALNKDKKLKSKEELEAIYGDIIKGKKVITFCQSGVRSSHTQMVLREILGVDDVYNYDGSWIEWSYAASDAGEDVNPELKNKVKNLTERWSDNKKEI